MKTIYLEQGSPEWKEHRATCRNASEAPVIMGGSSKTKRSDLVRMKATGSEKEFSRWVEEVLFAKGHEVEAMARPMAVEIAGEGLFPITATSDDDYLGCSYDGLSMDEVLAWECKQWNEAKAECVRNNALPEDDYYQVMQQLAVGAEKVLYMVTDGTPDKCVHMWVHASDNAQGINTLRPAWAQFDEDVKNYVHVEEAPKAVAEAVESLPAVFVQVSGSLEIVDNFKAFEERLNDFLNNEFIYAPKTDNEFATLKLQVKSLKTAENALDSAEAMMLSQVEAVNQAKRTKDTLSKVVRAQRLIGEKLIKAEEDSRRLAILNEGAEKMTAHIAQINKTLGERIRMPNIVTNFPGAMKNKRNASSLQDAIDTELARAKIEANQIADTIRINLEYLRTDAEGCQALFHDAQQLVTKMPDDFKNLVDARIAEHKAAEQKRLDAEREKIRLEEKKKLEDAQLLKEKEERDRIAAEQKAENDAAELTVEKSPVVQEVAKQAPRCATAAATMDAKPAAEKETKRTPTDEQIVNALMAHFSAEESEVIDWLLGMDLNRSQKARA